MDSTLFLHLFGLDPGQFEPGVAGPEKTEAGWAMSIVRRSDRRVCPHCRKSDAVVIKDRYVRKLRHAMPDGTPGTILVTRPKFLCRRCSRSFYPELEGLAPKSRMTSTEESAMRDEFAGMLTFAAIARRHGIDESAAVRMFDRISPTSREGRCRRSCASTRCSSSTASRASTPPCSTTGPPGKSSTS